MFWSDSNHFKITLKHCLYFIQFDSSFGSMMGSDSSRTNYPGKIPQGLNLPGDVAAEKHPEKGATCDVVA